MCAECYFYPLTWYVNPQCLSDMIPIKEIKDFALNLKYRDQNDFDQYIIDEFDNLLLKPGLFQICKFNQCQPTLFTHLGNKISIECKTNFIYQDGDCIAQIAYFKEINICYQVDFSLYLYYLSKRKSCPYQQFIKFSKDFIRQLELEFNCFDCYIR